MNKAPSKLNFSICAPVSTQSIWTYWLQGNRIIAIANENNSESILNKKCPLQ